jgi:hypothetical protein
LFVIPLVVHVTIWSSPGWCSGKAHAPQNKLLWLCGCYVNETIVSRIRRRQYRKRFAFFRLQTIDGSREYFRVTANTVIIYTPPSADQWLLIRMACTRHDDITTILIIIIIWTCSDRKNKGMSEKRWIRDEW